MKKLLLSVLLFSSIISKDFTNSIGMKFKSIPSGSFMMGTKAPKCPKDDPFTEKNEHSDCISSVGKDELPYHKVRVKSFYMATTEVTQYQYYKIMGNNPAHFKTEKLGYNSKNNPIETVNWDDANKFVKALNKKENTNKYRLPTEEEWEYSARAGSKGKWSFGNNENKLKNYAWYDKNAKNMGKGKKGYGTHPVAKKRANKFGLYDMHGNVFEWTSSCYTKNYNSKCYGDFKSIRSSSWDSIDKVAHSANRYPNLPDFGYDSIGFRLARTP